MYMVFGWGGEYVSNFMDQSVVYVFRITTRGWCRVSSTVVIRMPFLALVGGVMEAVSLSLERDRVGGSGDNDTPSLGGSSFSSGIGMGTTRGFVCKMGYLMAIKRGKTNVNAEVKISKSVMGGEEEKFQR